MNEPETFIIPRYSITREQILEARWKEIDRATKTRLEMGFVHTSRYIESPPLVGEIGSVSHTREAIFNNSWQKFTSYKKQR